MNSREAAALICSTLSTRQVAERYGLSPDRSGYIRCPFHDEKTPSLKLYKDPGRGFHCYGCGKGGSVIDFVMNLLSLNFPQTILRLNADFGLGVVSDNPNREAVERFNRNQAKKRREERKRQKLIIDLATEHCRLWQTIKTAPEWSDEWCAAWDKIHLTEYRLEVAQCQTN